MWRTLPRSLPVSMIHLSPATFLYFKPVRYVRISSFERLGMAMTLRLNGCLRLEPNAYQSTHLEHSFGTLIWDTNLGHSMELSVEHSLEHSLEHSQEHSLEHSQEHSLEHPQEHLLEHSLEHSLDCLPERLP